MNKKQKTIVDKMARKANQRASQKIRKDMLDLGDIEGAIRALKNSIQHIEDSYLVDQSKKGKKALHPSQQNNR